MDGSAPDDGIRLERLDWQLTTGCNLRCIHCRTAPAELLSPDDLSYRECRGVIRQIADFAPISVVFCGGEPLWRRDVLDLAQLASKAGATVSLESNGTLIDEAMAERIRDAGIVKVAVSLDGADRATHDDFRGHAGAFDAAIRGIRLLQGAGVATAMTTAVSVHNAHQLEDIVKLGEQLRVAALRLHWPVPVACGMGLAEGRRLTPAQMEWSLAWVHERARESQVALSAACWSGCGAGRSSAFLSHRGELYPCAQYPAAAGDLKRQSLREVWERSPLLRRLRAAPYPDCTNEPRAISA